MDNTSNSNLNENTVEERSDHERATASKKKASAMTRRMSFSTTRPWSSYAENYSSRLSGLRRSSSSGDFGLRKGNHPNSSELESNDTYLSTSLDTQQLRNLQKIEKQSSFRSLHAPRPFHQRSRSSPVAISLIRSPMTSNLSAGKHEVKSDKTGQESSDIKADQVLVIEEKKSTHCH